ncbi:hypothetical protein ABW19_dt0205667 [Dactylella cylindrospora]|nr:hypothetical protein ABW19_dt0205667 [Dactylella cylindrospora]
MLDYLAKKKKKPAASPDSLSLAKEDNPKELKLSSVSEAIVTKPPDPLPVSPARRSEKNTAFKAIEAAPGPINDDSSSDDDSEDQPWYAKSLKLASHAASSFDLAVPSLQDAGSGKLSDDQGDYWQVQGVIKNLTLSTVEEEPKIDEDQPTIQVTINGVPRRIPSILGSTAGSRKNSAVASFKDFSSKPSPPPPPPPPSGNSFNRPVRATAPARFSSGWQGPPSSLIPSRLPMGYDAPQQRSRPNEKRIYDSAAGLRKLRLKECDICGETSHLAKVCPKRSSPKVERFGSPATKYDGVRRVGGGGDGGGSETTRKTSQNRHTLENRPSMSRLDQKPVGFSIDRQLEFIETVRDKLKLADEYEKPTTDSI